MINIFRRLNPVNIVFLVFIGLVLRAGMFFRLPETLNNSISDLIARLIPWLNITDSLSSEANVMLALIFVLVQAVIFNRIINNYNLINRPTFLPALMYVTLSSLLPPFLAISSPLMCNFVLLWMMSKMLGIYRREEAISSMFDLGMLAGVGTLIYFPFIAMMLLIWICLLIFRPFNWREWIAALIGFATVYFFLAVYYYWNDSIGLFYKIWLPLTKPFPTRFVIDYYDYIVLIPVIIICAIGSIFLRQNFFRSYVHIRKSFQLLFVIFLLVVLSFYLSPQYRITHFLLAVPPVSVLTAYYFLNAQKSWFYELLYAVLAGAIIYFQVF
ncbi:beta-carotene 15,15'-monooxygenase [Pedobacter sp. BS3]|uniref:DUF6427 family protein n=1 Tax=Pedobacter sp. BS3 TaxID=2567937 RepID=UPI0011ECC4D1|nr:DUF6427 family protein [Pedobacter sp. BS3]TZF82218.1 beta-carotene 15,15'-monooxygenase [Pedobacter sp. BS3]